jgi:hypothetical protein
MFDKFESIQLESDRNPILEINNEQSVPTKSSITELKLFGNKFNGNYFKKNSKNSHFFVLFLA